MGTFRRTAHHLLGPRFQKQHVFFLYCGLLDVQHDRHLVHPFQVRCFFLPGTATDHSHVARIQRELVTPIFVSLAPLTSFPSSDANGGTDLQVFDASDCLTLRLLQVDRMWKRELKEF